MTRTLLHAFRFLFSASVAIALTACATNSVSNVPGSATGSQAAPAAVTIQNDSGQFSGTVQDSALGTGSASASLAQDESVVGGVVNVSYSGSNNVSYSFAAKTKDGLSLGGAQVASLASGVCSLSVTATYDTTKHVLSGTYKAANGCTGVTGTFSLTKECYYKRGGLLEIAPSVNGSSRIEPDHGVTSC